MGGKKYRSSVQLVVLSVHSGCCHKVSCDMRSCPQVAAACTTRSSSSHNSAGNVLSHTISCCEVVTEAHDQWHVVLDHWCSSWPCAEMARHLPISISCQSFGNNQ